MVDNTKPKIHIATNFDSTGVATYEEYYSITNWSAMRTVVESVGSGNIIQVQAKVNDSGSWNTLSTITGAGEAVSNINYYDQVRFVVTSYEASGNPKLIASVFSF